MTARALRVLPKNATLAEAQPQLSQFLGNSSNAWYSSNGDLICKFTPDGTLVPPFLYFEFGAFLCAITCCKPVYLWWIYPPEKPWSVGT